MRAQRTRPSTRRTEASEEPAGPHLALGPQPPGPCDSLLVSLRWGDRGQNPDVCWHPTGQGSPGLRPAGGREACSLGVGSPVGGLAAGVAMGAAPPAHPLAPQPTLKGNPRGLALSSLSPSPSPPPHSFPSSETGQPRGSLHMPILPGSRSCWPHLNVLPQNLCSSPPVTPPALDPGTRLGLHAAPQPPCLGPILSLR